jgi:hypothetical protein
MDLPAAEKLVATARSVRSPIVLQPTSGGSVPLDMIIEILGTNTIRPYIILEYLFKRIENRTLSAPIWADQRN